MTDFWSLFEDEKLFALMGYFQDKIAKNKAKRHEYTALTKLCMELRHEMMLRDIERKTVDKMFAKVDSGKKDWRNRVKNVGGHD